MISGNETQVNQLWAFNISSKQWKHLSGSSEAEGSAVYGIQGLASADNTPESLRSTVCWQYDDHAFYMGFGRDSSGVIQSVQKKF